jgi:hypothetical protein
VELPAPKAAPLFQAEGWETNEGTLRSLLFPSAISLEHALVCSRMSLSLRYAEDTRNEGFSQPEVSANASYGKPAALSCSGATVAPRKSLENAEETEKAW